jgi:predicted ribosome quality control (RQC) complex YloA/Tae2 family protein
LQNDVVTFQIASKKDYFFHIANQSGSHVILHHPEPSHELILLAGKLVLSLANLNDGQVTYAPVKYIRKTKKLGLVKIEKHKMIHIKVGTDDLSEWIQTAKRY